MMENALTQYKPKTAVEIRREMASVPEVMDALRPVERSVFLASTKKTVSEFSEYELISEIKEDLSFIAKDVGARLPAGDELKYLVVRVAEILKRYYPGFSMRDFKMAFEMCIVGELDDFLPKGREGQADRGHYQNFNAEYICKVLAAYKMRRAQVLKRASDAMPEKEPERNPEMEKKYSIQVKRDCVAAFRHYQEHGVLPPMSPIAEMLYYNTLSDVGLAPEIVVTLDEQKAILQRTVTEFARNGMLGDMNRLKIAGPEAPELQGGAYSLARKKALKSAFAKMQADGIEITDYVKID